MIITDIVSFFNLIRLFLNYCVKLNESDFFLFAQSLFLNENPFVPTKIKHVLNDYFSQMSLVKKYRMKRLQYCKYKVMISMK